MDKDEDLKCQICLTYFTSRRLLQRHQTQCFHSTLHYQKRPDDGNSTPLDHMCIACGEDISDYPTLAWHWKERHSVLGKTRCYVCGKDGLVTEQQIANHNRFHENVRSLELRFISISCIHHCGAASFSDNRTLREHLLCNHSFRVCGINDCEELLIDNGECSSRYHSNDIEITRGAEEERARQTNCKKLWKCPTCEDFHCTYGLRQRSHNLLMHKDSFSMFCRFCGLMYRSASRLRDHMRKCQFKECLKQDISGQLYVRLWRRVASDSVWMEKMMNECNSEIVNKFLQSDMSEKDLLDLVPIIRKF